MNFVDILILLALAALLLQAIRLIRKGKGACNCQSCNKQNCPRRH